MWITVALAQPFCARVRGMQFITRTQRANISDSSACQTELPDPARNWRTRVGMVEYLKRADLERNEMRYFGVILVPGYRVCWFRQKPAAVYFGSEITAMAV